jgi:hypothetical protein
MSIHFLAQLVRGQLSGLEQALEAVHNELEDSLKSNGDPAVGGRELQRIIRQCLPIPRILGDLWHSTFERIKTHLEEDYDETERRLRECFDPGLRILARVTELIETYERRGGSVEEAAELRSALGQTRRLEAQIFEHWPRFSNKDVAEARAALARGECLDLEDAFAQIAGVDRETWRRRVEERRQARNS